MQKTSVVRLVAGMLLSAVVVAILVFLPWQSAFYEFLESIHDMGAMAPLLFGAVYVLAVVLFVPGSILTMGAGFVFGIVEGTITVSIASTLGAAAAFLLGRTIARPWIEEIANRNPKFRAFDEAIKQKGFRIVLLLRLSPVFPFNLLNYSLGLTSVSFRDYVLASWIGMLPGALLYIYIGSTLKNLTDLAAGKIDNGAATWALFGVGLVATVIATSIVARLARRALREATHEKCDSENRQ